MSSITILYKYTVCLTRYADWGWSSFDDETRCLLSTDISST